MSAKKKEQEIQKKEEGTEESEMAQRNEQLHDEILKLTAGIENFRRQATEEISGASRRAVAHAVRTFAPALDAFRIALVDAHTSSKSDDGSTHSTSSPAQEPGQAGQAGSATLRSEQAGQASRGWVEGMEKVYERFVQAFFELGVVPIAAEGEYDPKFHEAVERVPGKEYAVVEQVGVGWMWEKDEQVIVSAKVKVGSGEKG